MSHSTAYLTEHARSLRFDREAFGQPQAWSVTYRGLEYPGEVVVAEAVNSEWGRTLQGDVSFRIVFYTVPRRISRDQIQDPRIAMAVPRRSADHVQESLSQEIQAIHEAKERYITGTEPDTLSLRTSMDERQESLLGELARRETHTYSQGRIYTRGGIRIEPSDVFVGGGGGGGGVARSWVERLVKAMFHQVYPSLPFEHDQFPDTLTTQRIEAVYRGLIQKDPADAAAADFGPPLGLATSNVPPAFDAGECRVVEMIAAELDARGGDMPAQELLDLLCVNNGLNRPLATLYLMAYVTQGHAQVELTPEHSVELREGGPFPSDRVSWDLAREILFTRCISDELAVVRVQPTVAWNAVLPYASLVVEGLRLSQEQDDIGEQEGRLVEALEEMQTRIERSRDRMKALVADLHEDAKAALASLDRLQVLCSATGYRGFYAVAVGSFDGPSDLRGAIDLYERLDRLGDLAPEITRIGRYLDEMTFGRRHRDLELKRETVSRKIGLDALLANPSLWASVKESFQQLQLEYKTAYLVHHTTYHQEAIELVTRMDGLRKQVEALARFNEVPEFNGPLGTDLPGRFRDLGASVKTCTLREDEISLGKAPLCPECRLELGEDVPRRETALVFRGVESAMREYNGRLSSEGVRLILAHPTKEQLDKLVDLVQVGDLSALANLLDDDVVDFLRNLVRRQ